MASNDLHASTHESRHREIPKLTRESAFATGAATNLLDQPSTSTAEVAYDDPPPLSPQVYASNGDSSDSDIAVSDTEDIHSGDNDVDDGHNSGTDSAESDNGGPNPKRKRSQGDQRKINQSLRSKGLAYYGWKRQNSGQYKYQQKNPRQAKAMGPPCNSKFCFESTKRKCDEITEVQRQMLFDNYWSEMNYQQRQVYVSSLVDITEVKQRRSDSENPRKSRTYTYHLIVEGERKCVCKTMFLHTFDISQWCVQSWTAKSQDTGRMHRQTREATRTFGVSKQRKNTQSFLSQLPKLPSHYCRQNTNKEYLEEEIGGMTKLYDMFKSFCEERGYGLPSKSVLRSEFKQANLGFFQPRKDQCDKCCSFKVGNVSEAEYQAHRVKKERAHEEKNNDKIVGGVDRSVSVWSMDVQAVLIAPKLHASALYYRTKLACHNFTMYHLNTKHTLCYFWHESEGDMSASSFASCIIHNLTRVVRDPSVKTIILWSDGCGYQNRNVVLSNALVDFCVHHNVQIVQKYLEKGHTQMEVDSVHSTIERKLKTRSIYYPGNYVEVMQEARPAQPYEVI